MAKGRILDGLGQEQPRTAPQVKDVKPFGSSILVEMLTSEEALSTKIFLKEGTDVGAPQGYVLSMGERLKPEELGLKVGDRVLLQGTFVPVMNYEGGHRQRGIVEIHNIKALLIEG